MGDPYTPGKIGITIKVPESRKFAGDNPWLVFEGTNAEDLKEKIGATFGIETEGLVLADVVINAHHLASGLSTASQQLGGTVVPDTSTSASQGQQSTPSGDMLAEAARQSPTQVAKDVDPILEAIERATKADEVRLVWAENQDAFSNNSKYMEAAKAKTTALSN